MAKCTSLAKVTAPFLSSAVQRDRLYSILSAHRETPLHWVTGPPGAGKSTLIASHAGHEAKPFLWYQVDAGDVDPASLFHYLCEAARSLIDKQTHQLPRFAAEHHENLERFTRTFFRKLFSLLPSHCRLIFDNCQEASGSPFDRIIVCATQELPSGSAITCMSRNPPPALFAPLIGAERVFVLRWESLRFTLEETRAVCRKRSIQDEVLVQALHQQSEGWAAGITLLLEHLSIQPGRVENPPSEPGHVVFDYFASLIFDRLEERTRQVLLALAFVPYVSRSMAARLSGNPHASEILGDLYERRMFIDRRPSAQPVYQFHALFRAFLQSKLRSEWEPDRIRQLLMHSAHMLMLEADLESASTLSALAEDWDAVIAAIRCHAGRLLDEGRGHTVERLIASLPEGIVRSNGWLQFWLGSVRVQTDPAEAIELFGRALSRFRIDSDQEGELLCLAAALNAAFIGFLALDAMDIWLNELLARLDEPATLASDESALRVWGVLCAALFWLRPWHARTTDCIARVESLLRSVHAPSVALSAASSALATASFSGEFEAGESILAMTAHLVQSPEASPTEAAWWCVLAGFMRFFEARYEDALELLKQGEDIARKNGLEKTLVMATLHRIAVEFRVHGWPVARRTFETIRGTRTRYPMAAGMLNAYEARIAHWEGRRDQAAEFAMRMFDDGRRSGSRYQEMLFGMLAAELLIDAGRGEEAAALLQASEDLISRAPALTCWRAPARLIRSRLALVREDTASAAALLGESLRLAAAGKGRFYFRHLECTMPPMFSMALRQGIEVDFVRDMIRAFRLRPGPDAPDLWPRPVEVRTLGRFEILVDGKPLEYARKVPRKTLGLLKALVVFGGRNVSEHSLCDALWPDDEADAAKQSLDITIVRLRRLLGHSGAVIQAGGKISLDVQVVWSDAQRFDELAAAPDTARSALQLYAGDLLPEDRGESWSCPARERLRGKFIHLLISHGRTLEEGGATDEAIALYYRGLDVDPILEAFYQGIMRCYQRKDLHAEAISVFQRLSRTLSAVLDASPSPESHELCAQSLKACKNRASMPVNVIDIGLFRPDPTINARR